MDNNGQQPVQPQPMQPTMPQQPEQPMNQQSMGQPAFGQQNMSQPMTSPTQGQPYAYPYQAPYPQPISKPPKQPMDPAKKKKIILIVSICSGVVALGIAAAIVIPILLRVNYGTAYSAVKELKPKIYSIYQSYDCEYVINYVDSSYTSTKQYSEYIEGCKEVYNSGTDDLVSKLENTDGVKRNDEIRTQFEKFKSNYTALSSGNSEDLDAKLNLWQARHNFVVAAKDLSTSSSDSEFTTAANYLIDSGNDTLKSYGEGWLEYRTAINAAYRAYNNASWSDPNYKQLREDYNNKKTEYNNWLAANKPDIKTIAPLSFDDTSKMYNEFNTLYRLIAKTYQENYNSGSGDCTEFLGEVYCE